MIYKGKYMTQLTCTWYSNRRTKNITTNIIYVCLTELRTVKTQ